MDIEEIKLLIENSINKIQSIIDNDVIQYRLLSKYETFEKLCISKGVRVCIEDKYDLFKDDILKIDYKKLYDFVIKIKEKYSKLFITVSDNWNNYNENYKNIIKRKLENYNNYLFSYDLSNMMVTSSTDLITIFGNYYRSIIKIDFDETDVLENFAYTDKNYVVFGKNGSGKTTLLNHVKSHIFNTNSFVIPANRSIKIGDLSNINQEYSKDLNSLFGDIYRHPLDVLSLMMYDRDYDDMKTGVTDRTMDKFITLFNSLNLERKIVIRNKRIYLYNEKINEYYATSASDGEKTIMLYIMYILFLPSHSYLFIDEPENHLNGALLSELFDTLEIERKDVIFIYFTHNIDFIETRSNVSLIHLDKFNASNEWIFNKIEDFQEIPIDVIIKIIGTKKAILFIEGKKESFDFKIYSTLFPELKVITVDSCQKVIDNCKSIRSNSILCRKAYGIIDNDFREQSEIDDLKINNIFVLDYNEIENLLLCEELLNYTAEKMGRIEKIIDVKKNIIDYAKLTKEGIIQDFIGKTYYRVMKKIKINYDGDIKKLNQDVEKINEDNKKLFFDMLQVFIEELDKIISDEDYNQLIKRMPNKGFISKITKLGFGNPDAYVDFLLSAFKNNIEIRNKIRSKYFNNYFNN